MWRYRRCTRIDLGKEVYYALPTEEEKPACWSS